MTNYQALPYRCPKCFHNNCFPDVTTLRSHLEYEHSYVHLSIPLSVAMVTSSPRSQSSMSNISMGSTVEEKKIGFKDQARELEKQLVLMAGKDSPYFPRHGNTTWTHSNTVSPASVLGALLNPSQESSTPRPGYRELDQEAAGEMYRLKQELSDKERILAKASRYLQEVQSEKVKAEEETKDLSDKVESHSMEIASLKSQLKEQHKDIKQDERKLLELSQFLEDIDDKQTTARESLKRHLDTLVDKAEHAEIEMLHQSRIGSSSSRTYESPGSSVEEYHMKARRSRSLSNEDVSNESFTEGKQLPQYETETTPPQTHPLQKSSTDQMSPIPSHSERPNQHRQQQLDILQQQLETLQHQQNQLQQFLVQISERPTQFHHMQDMSPLRVKQLLTLPESKHVNSQNGSCFLSKTSPPGIKQGSAYKVQESNQFSHNYLPHQGDAIGKPNQPESQSKYTTSPSKTSVTNDLYGTSKDYEEKDMDPNSTLYHSTLPRQPSSILPSRLHNRTSLSSTMPSYAGSDLPNFNIDGEDEDDIDDVIQKTEVPFENTYLERQYNIMPNGVPKTKSLPHLDLSTHQSVLNRSTDQYSCLPNEQNFPNSNDTSDAMNLKELEEVFKDLINRKQSQKKNQRSDLVNDGKIPGLTSLPNRQHMQRLPENIDARAQTLPNGIPKNPTMHKGLTSLPGNEGATFSSQNVPEIQINSRSNSVASSRGLSVSYTTVSELSDLDDSLTDVTYTPVMSACSGSHQGVNIPSAPVPMTHSQMNALLCIFSHLDQQSLMNCARVCQEWKQLSRHPSLWRTMRLANHRISSKFLQTISSWCSELEWLYLDNLKPRKQRSKETTDDYKRDIKGCLESGLEYLLHNSGSQLISLTIHNCHSILTERCLWLASCYCMNLCSVTYVSQTDPAGHEVIWALGAGCRKIESLKIPPGFPCDQPHKFSNRCAQMISRCWPQLKALSIGGKGVDGKGLVTIAKNCPKLQVLELDHMSKISEPVAIAMTQNGLRGLQVLIFRHTPVTTKSILQFNGACPQLRSMSLHLSPSDYFTQADENEQENAARFEQLHNKLQVLAKRPGLRDVLQLFITTPL